MHQLYDHTLQAAQACKYPYIGIHLASCKVELVAGAISAAYPYIPDQSVLL